MGNVLDDKIELFNDRLITETLRQWIILITFTILFVLVAISISTLIRTYRKVFTSDIAIFFLIEMRIVLLITSEFALPSRFLLFLSDSLHLLTMTILFYNFTKNLLVHKQGIFSMYKIIVG